MVRWMLLLLGLTLFVSPGCDKETVKREFPADWYWDDRAVDAKAHVEIEGKSMPALSLSNWMNGEVKPEDMKGKVVLVDLYATWCGPCIAAIPHNNEMSKKYRDKGFILIGVCTSESGQEKMEASAKEHGVQYPIAKDPELKTQAAWGVRYYPTYAVVDRKGILRAVGLSPDAAEKVVEKLLAEKE